MFFSVIVPVYKVERYLSACVNSVLQQTFTDFELILVDDGSPDTCPRLCDDYARQDARIKVIHKQNGGLVSARQAGIRMAQGEYVFHLDSDDLIEADVLQTAHRLIAETGCDVVSFGRKWVKEGQTVAVSNDEVEEGLYRGDALTECLYEKLLMDKHMHHLSCYVTGKALKRELVLPFQLAVSETISLGEDLCCMIPFYLHVNSVYISHQTGYWYTVRTDSLSKEFNSHQIYLIEKVIYELRKNDLSAVSDMEKQLHRYSAFMCFAILAAAAEGYHFRSIRDIKHHIRHSLHSDYIAAAEFDTVTPKSRITLFLMKKRLYAVAFYFLAFCKLIKNAR